MSMMYPFHVPTIPLKWEEQVWLTELCPTIEQALLTTLEQKRNNQRMKNELRNLNDNVCGLRTDDSEEDDNDSGDDHN